MSWFEHLRSGLVARLALDPGVRLPATRITWVFPGGAAIWDAAERTQSH